MVPVVGPGAEAMARSWRHVVLKLFARAGHRKLERDDV